MIVFFAKCLVYLVLNWLVTFDVSTCDIHDSYPPCPSTELKKKTKKVKDNCLPKSK